MGDGFFIGFFMVFLGFMELDDMELFGDGLIIGVVPFICVPAFDEPACVVPIPELVFGLGDVVVCASAATGTSAIATAAAMIAFFIRTSPKGFPARSPFES